MPSITYAFARGSNVYVTAKAREQGLLIGGQVQEIVIRVGMGGGASPVILYRIPVTSIVPPPKDLFEEGLLSSETEARALAKAYHDRRAVLHQTASDSLS